MTWDFLQTRAILKSEAEIHREREQNDKILQEKKVRREPRGTPHRQGPL